ncbi:MAG: PleD family two-component system response regulator [Anaerolineae bacterium]
MKKILIVDDQKEIRELVRVTLRIGDYEIIEASSGDEAVTVAQAERPDLIFLDVMMPQSPLDGFEVCRALKGDPRTEGCTIVLLTALDKPEDLAKGEQAGADDYFTKPFSPLQLMNKVDEVLG